MILRNLIGLCCLLAGNAALAQCPYGIPNNPGCVPPDAWPQNQDGTSAANVRQPYWVYTWGALARDKDVLGVSTGLDSKRQAEKVAIKDCRDRGGGRCKILLAYNHQCVAVASGNGVAWGGGPDLDETKQRVLDKCRALEGNGICTIYYSNCTKPYLVE